MAVKACGVIGLQARAAKIKQVCSVTTRGGEKEKGRGQEGGVLSQSSTQETIG